LIDNVAKAIKPKLEEIRWLLHLKGKSEIGRGRDYGHQLASASFDRSKRCHILNGSGNLGRAVFVACWRADRN
jgi:hypothetical protein